MISALEDDELVARYLSGDMRAFEALYERHKGALFRFVNRQLPHAQAEDAFQEVWSKFIANVQHYQAQGTFTAYLFRMAHNVLIDRHRKQARSAGVVDAGESIDPDALEDRQGDVEETAMREQAQEKLLEELAKLPLHQRTAWLLRQETPLTVTQIAQLTDTTPEGVKSRLRYANDKLIAGLKRYVR